MPLPPMRPATLLLPMRPLLTRRLLTRPVLTPLPTRRPPTRLVLTPLPTRPPRAPRVPSSKLLSTTQAFPKDPRSGTGPFS